jgi:very-short-patch-repair endonuclease
MASQTARRLRVDQTEVEKQLWSRLRNRGLLGLKLGRQGPLGDLVADFVCADQALVVELDGGRHASSEAADEFWNNEVGENIEGVLIAIAGACGINVGDPHPSPLPEGGGEARPRLRERSARPRRMLSRYYPPRPRG